MELRGVTKLYQGAAAPAVSDLNLSVRRGEFISFLGPSGSGKTTTLNMIAGFITPTSGQILIDGTDIATLPAHKRNLGMVFQNYALFPTMTVWDNVAFPLVERKVPKAVIKEKVAAALEMVHLTGYEKRRPRELSGGQQQRVALTRALVFDPPILLMDEPLGALDKKLREQLQLEVKRIHRELGLTFLFVTHDQEEAMALSDTVVVFNEGRIQQIGPPDELYRRPNSRFVAEFLGESNLIEGVVRRAAGSWELGTTEGTVPLDGWSPAEDDPSGERVAMFRPEDVRLHDGPQAPAGSWPATVEEVVYLGSEERVIVRTAAGRSVSVRLLGDPVLHRLKVGDTVHVSFEPRNLWLLPGA